MVEKVVGARSTTRSKGIVTQLGRMLEWVIEMVGLKQGRGWIAVCGKAERRK